MSSSTLSAAVGATAALVGCAAHQRPVSDGPSPAPTPRRPSRSAPPRELLAAEPAEAGDGVEATVAIGQLEASHARPFELEVRG